jgi:hypothetical protein
MASIIHKDEFVTERTLYKGISNLLNQYFYVILFIIQGDNNTQDRYTPRVAVRACFSIRYDFGFHYPLPL